jgi:hypothetical protein
LLGEKEGGRKEGTESGMITEELTMTDKDEGGSNDGGRDEERQGWRKGK